MWRLIAEIHKKHLSISYDLYYFEMFDNIEFFFIVRFLRFFENVEKKKRLRCVNTVHTISDIAKNMTYLRYSKNMTSSVHSRIIFFLESSQIMNKSKSWHICVIWKMWRLIADIHTKYLLISYVLYYLKCLKILIFFWLWYFWYSWKCWYFWEMFENVEKKRRCSMFKQFSQYFRHCKKHDIFALHEKYDFKCPLADKKYG